MARKSSTSRAAAADAKRSLTATKKACIKFKTRSKIYVGTNDVACST